MTDRKKGQQTNLPSPSLCIIGALNTRKCTDRIRKCRSCPVCNVSARLMAVRFSSLQDVRNRWSFVSKSPGHRSLWSWCDLRLIRDLSRDLSLFRAHWSLSPVGSPVATLFLCRLSVCVLVVCVFSKQRQRKRHEGPMNSPKQISCST